MPSVPLETIGEKLREARTRNGYSVEQISKLITVARKNIELIEEGISPDLPEPYVRGIVRLYARQVGLTVEDPAEARPEPRPDPREAVPVFQERPAHRPELRLQHPADLLGQLRAVGAGQFHRATRVGVGVAGQTGHE